MSQDDNTHTPIPLVGFHEVREMVGVPYSTLRNWRDRRKDFPPPIARLACGDIWDARAITRWLAINTLY